MLHVTRADDTGTFCGTTEEGIPGDVCVVCLDLHSEVERKIKPAADRLVKQFNRGLIGAVALSINLYVLATKAEAEVLGVRS
jgi:hypothetical protein